MKKSRSGVSRAKGYDRRVSYVVSGARRWLGKFFARSEVRSGSAASGFLTERDLRARLTPAALVGGIIPARAIVTLYGAPGDGKTFLALAMGLSIATGQAHLSRSVRPGGVVYVAGEGIDGLQRRVDAWKSLHNVRGEIEDLFFEDQAVSLLKERDLREFCKKLRALPTAPILIVLETLALCIGEGDENSARDMGRLIAAAKRIRDEVGATVMLVHHTNKLGILRGSSALAAASDTVVKVKRVGDQITISCEKQKDFAVFEPIVVRLTPVTHDGGVTSCTIVPEISSADGSRPTPISAVNRAGRRGAMAHSGGNGLDRVRG